VTPEELWKAVQAAFPDNAHLAFEPPLGSWGVQDDHWGGIDVGYEPGWPGGVIIWATYLDEGDCPGLAEAAIAEMAGHFGETALDSKGIKEHVMSSRRAFELEVVQLSEGARQVCAVIERFIASRLDGLVYVGGEGVYDADLQPIQIKS
jgi:hypothetical protein